MPFLRCSFFFLILIVSTVAAGTGPDTTQAKKDSVIHALPIPDLGTTEPFSVTTPVIPSLQITKNDYRSLYDVIGIVPGVFVRDLASPGAQEQLFINGLTDRNVAVLVDGIPYNDHYTGSLNLSGLPVEMIDHIEVITGPTAVYYDGRSNAAAINLVTKNFTNNRAITVLRFSQGVNGYSQTDASFAQNIANGLNLSFALSHNGFGSNKEAAHYRGRFNNSNLDAWQLRSKLRYDITDWFGITATYAYERSWKGLFGGVDLDVSPTLYDIGASAVNNDAYEKSFRHHSQITAAFLPFADSSLLATFSFYHQDRLREFRDEENRSFAVNGLFIRRDFPSLTRGFRSQVISHSTDLRMLVYADLNRTQSADVLSGGAKAELFPGTAITMTPFVTMRTAPHQSTANAGADLHATWGPLSFFGTATRNIINDRSFSGSALQPKTAAFYDLSLRPIETADIDEAGVQWKSGGTTLRLSARQTTLFHPIVLDTLPLTGNATYYDPGTQHFRSAVVSAHVQWENFHAEGSASFTDVKDVMRDSVSLRLFPQWTANGSIYFDGWLANGHLDLRIGIRGTFVSQQSGMSPLDEYAYWIPSARVRYGPVGTADFFMVAKIGDAYVHLIWENLAGNQYFLAPFYPMYDRNIRFGVTWEFVD